MATARLEMSRHRLPLWAALAGLLPLLPLTLSGLDEGFLDPLLPGLRARFRAAAGLVAGSARINGIKNPLSAGAKRGWAGGGITCPFFSSTGPAAAGGGTGCLVLSLLLPGQARLLKVGIRPPKLRGSPGY